MKVKVKKKPAPIETKQVKGETLVYESDMRIAVAFLNELFSKHQNDTLFEYMEDDTLSCFIAAVLNAAKGREWLSQHDPILSEMIYKGVNVSEHRIDEAIRTYSSVSTPFLVHSLDGRNPN